MPNLKHVIVDVDVGSDDAMALLVLFFAERKGLIKIEAICCTMGNTSVENVCKNVVRLLETVGRTDIPVYKGAADQIIRPLKPNETFHGGDGFGDLEFEHEPDLSIIQKEPAIVGMYKIAKQHENDVYLICLGPLTNVALAMRVFPDFTTYVKQIFTMGGNYKAIGNVTKTAEYNFYIDPEAAHIVLNSSELLMTLVTWETCLDSSLTFDWRFGVLGLSEDPGIQLLNKVEKSIYTDMTEPYFPCDAYLVAVFLYPDCIESSSRYHATVELHGYETRGQVVLDHKKKLEENVIIIEKINKNIFKNILLQVASLV